MGTRAQFFIGNPMDLETREWLGCVAWDGYPDGDCGGLAKASSEVGFRALVADLKAKRDDFCDPAERSFPFPWRNDLFLTDYTYALFDGAVQMTCFHRGFIPLSEYLKGEAVANAYHDGAERLPSNVPAPVSALPPGPDSIIVISA
ncbi:hypothetical protein [Devosia sp.]|uniref:hypothetical protein n=1 Tax=Devosia sp. TaxID=1871048 RepID=UPI002FC850A8